MIFIDDGNIKVGGVVLPGLFKSIEISDEVTMDEQDVEGSNTKAKQVTGYDDAKITIELVLDDSDGQGKYDKLEIIQNVFRNPGQDVPSVYDIVNEDTAARGISQVVFKSLDHKNENKSSQLPVTLEFTTYNPPTITATSSSGSSSKKKSSSGSDAGDGSTLTDSYKDYLANDRDKSPSVDDDTV